YTNDLPIAANFITTNTFDQLAQVVALIVSAIFMVIINPFLTLIYFIMFPLLILLQMKIAKPISDQIEKVSMERASFNAIVNDSLQNPSTIITYSLESAMEERYLNSYNKFYDEFMKYVTTLLKLAISGVLASNLPTWLLIIASALYVASGRMTVAEFIAFITMYAFKEIW
ncbi:MAG: ABC transporter transmembrane domain-containing protein, partial [Oscillospiraceae bacterium]|nr:ABC transporter transmembrane domain-containing protein [Oscillospiraceae bacterium]